MLRASEFGFDAGDAATAVLGVSFCQRRRYATAVLPSVSLCLLPLASG